MKIRQYKDILLECLVTLRHARTFVTSREKMHPTGIKLYDDLIIEVTDALNAPGPEMPALETSPALAIGTNTGHGHVWPRPDGMRARCGGPGMCKECSQDQARLQAAIPPDVAKAVRDQCDCDAEIKLHCQFTTTEKPCDCLCHSLNRRAE